MGTPLAPVALKINESVKGFMVKKKIGEGACGLVYLVNFEDKNGKNHRAAMKVEPLMKNKDDEVLKMEIQVLRKVQNSLHTCRCLGSGRTDKFTYVVMSLLGKELTEIRKRLPNRKMQASSTLRLGIQIVKGLQDLHEAGFVHRDVKPTNLAMGLTRPMFCYVFDFGLCRQILIEKNGKKMLREPRKKVMFRGTVRYCSANVHQSKEQGRHDDLYGALYSLIELTTAQLPWKGMVRKDAAKKKEQTNDEQLCKGCPSSFLEMAKSLRSLTFADTPPYHTYIKLLKGDLPPKLKMTDPYEWTKPGQKDGDNENGNGSDRDKPDRDRDENADANTVNEVEDSVVTEDKDSQSQDYDNFAKEDTLEDIQ